MCAIIGAVLRPIQTAFDLSQVNNILNDIWQASHARGRDGRGFVVNASKGGGFEGYREITRKGASPAVPPVVQPAYATTVIGNLRAEPTTEYVRSKRLTDQQPYRLQEWAIVHNGTISNDKALRAENGQGVHTTIDSAAIAEQLAHKPGTFEGFHEAILQLRGSYAILASNQQHPDKLFVAANYRPIWYTVNEYGVFFASAREFLPGTAQMLQPYSLALFNAYGMTHSESLYHGRACERALVVCSGGMDSVVSAVYAQKTLHMDVHLIHFLYGSRAEGPEVEAVKAVAKEMGVPLTLFPLRVYSKGDSPLLDPDSKVAGGEAGAEFAHEWVPARNLLLLSVATAFAEARGIDTIVLGNNLEEAGAYPDNEPEFIARFNDLLPFAVGDGKRMKVLMPVGNYMKHEIVALGVQLGAPLHLTWSCYRAGEMHCGTCGPCYMRRTAFAINNLPEVITYKDTE